VIFDTDIFIHIERGNMKAAALVNAAPQRFLSVQTAMELMQGAKDQRQLKRVRSYLATAGFITLPLTENIGHRALIYVEQHTLASGLYSGDAIIAATAVENHLPLASGNAKHFRPIKELDLRVFRP
jgi:predicted nucleic acid-binding protein